MNYGFLKTKEEQETASANLTALLEHNGWKLFEQILDANIKVVEEQILSGFFINPQGDKEEYTQEEMNRKRDKLVVYKEIKNTPRMLIEGFNSSEGIAPNLDPYTTREELKKARNE